jgi:hypothetical protein
VWTVELILVEEARLGALEAIGLEGATSQRMAELELTTDFVHGLFVDGLVRVERTAQAPASRALYMLTAASAKAIGRHPALIRPA